jgi:hypothetical protein
MAKLTKMSTNQNKKNPVWTNDNKILPKLLIKVFLKMTKKKKKIKHQFGGENSRI